MTPPTPSSILPGDGSVLVTGGTGSTGRWLLRWLLGEAGASRVIAFSRDEQKHHDLLQDPEFQHPALHSMVGDVRDRHRLREAMEGISLVLHTAAMKHVPIAEANPSEAMRTNVEGTVNLIEAARDAGVDRVVAHSTDKAVEPACVYGTTKMMMEKLLIDADRASKQGGPRFDIARHGNLIGSRGSVIPLFLRQKSSGRLTITEPSMTRFWIGGDELISLIEKMLVDARGGEIFVPKSPACRLDTLAEAIAPAATLVATGSRPGEKFHEALTGAEESGRIREFRDYLVIEPPHGGGRNEEAGTAVAADFQLTSDGTRLLDSREMRALLQSSLPAEFNSKVENSV